MIELAFYIGLAANVVTIVSFFRRQPPSDSTKA